MSAAAEKIKESHAAFRPGGNTDELKERAMRCRLASLLRDFPIAGCLNNDADGPTRGTVRCKPEGVHWNGGGFTCWDATPDGKVTTTIWGCGEDRVPYAFHAVLLALGNAGYVFTAAHAKKYFLPKRVAKEAQADAKRAENLKEHPPTISLRARKYKAVTWNDWTEHADLADHADRVVSHLHAEKGDPSKPENCELFWSSELLCQIQHDADSIRIEPLGDNTLSKHLSDVGNWRATRGDRIRTIPPPGDVINRILSTNVSLPFAPLQRIGYAPFFTVDGTLVQTKGYHPKAKAYLHCDLKVPKVRPVPRPVDVARARRVLEDIFQDFPACDGDGKNEATRAHMLAHLLQPFMRDLVPGSAPMYGIFKKNPGEGASKFLDACSLICNGRLMQMTPYPHGTEDELGKCLHALLIEGATHIAFDNQKVSAVLDSASLASALTAGVVKRRVLGHTKTNSAEVRATISVNGNNLVVSSELARRTLPILFDTKMPKPEKRDGFKYPDLEGTILKHRGLLVWACLTLVQNWLAKGRPAFSGKTLASFESFSRTMGGILEAAGIPGFLGNRDSIAVEEQTDPALVAFCNVWFERWGDEWVKAGNVPSADINLVPDLVSLANVCRDIDLGLRGKTDRSTWGKALGWRLKPHLDQTIDIGSDRWVKVQKNVTNQGAHYRLEIVEPGDADS